MDASTECATLLLFYVIIMLYANFIIIPFSVSTETAFYEKGKTIHLRAYKDVLTYGGHNQFSTIFPPSIMERGAVGTGSGGGGGGVVGSGGGGLGGLGGLGTNNGGSSGGGGMSDMSDNICLQDLVGGNGGGVNHNGVNNSHLTDHLHNHHSLHDSVAAAVSVSSAITGLMSGGGAGGSSGLGHHLHSSHHNSHHDLSNHHHHHHHSVVPHTPTLHEPLEKLKREFLYLSLA